MNDDIDYTELDSKLQPFLKSIPKDMERGTDYEWECPLCGGTVHGGRSPNNGHLHAQCDSCDIGIMQ